jgi:hypothetical protein
VRASVGYKSFCVENFNAVKKRHGVFTVNGKRSSAQRENKTQSERDGCEIGCLCMSQFPL